MNENEQYDPPETYEDYSTSTADDIIGTGAFGVLAAIVLATIVGVLAVGYEVVSYVLEYRQ